MRDRARQRAAAVAKSHRATPEELREAAKRVKEIEVELGKLDIQPETKVGETRQQRYARVLKLRSMREEFQGDRALEVHNPPRSMAVALIMTVASFLLCAFCVGGSYFALQIVNQKPDPSATVQNFWDDMEHKNYVDLHDNYLSPTLRVELDQARLSAEASQADNNFGQVSSYKLLKQTGDMQNTGDVYVRGRAWRHAHISGHTGRHVPRLLMGRQRPRRRRGSHARRCAHAHTSTYRRAHERPDRLDDRRYQFRAFRLTRPRPSHLAAVNGKRMR